MTAADIITNRVRNLLHDTDPLSYIWSNDILVYFLNDAVLNITTRLPESLLTGAYALSAFTWGSITIASTLPIQDRYANAVVNYVCWRALAHDGTDKRDLKRSGEFGKMFTAETGIVLG